MKLLRNYEPALRYGAKILPSDILGGMGTTGNIYYVVPSTETFYNQFLSDNNYSYPDGTQSVYSTLLDAYNACVTNRGDVIVMSGNTSHALTTGILWAKNRITVIGMGDSNRLFDQGTKIVNVVGDATAYVIKVTGTRNTFINLKFINVSTVATSLTVAQDGAEGTLWENCSFEFSTTTNLGLTTAHEFLAGSDSATYIKCTFGTDTILTSGARSVFHIQSINGFEFKSNQLQDCTFIISSSSATATFVRLNAITDILFNNTFDSCKFMASVDTVGGIALTAGAIQTGTGVTKGCLNLAYPSVFNCGVSQAGSGFNTAVQVVAPTSAATAIKGIQPTA